MLRQTVRRSLSIFIAMTATLLIDAPSPATAASESEVHALSRDEKAIAAHVDAHVGEARALLQRVVDINSGTQNFAGVREVGKVFAAELDALGFTTRWADGSAFGRAGHLIATRAGKAAKTKVLLIGHLDTVFEPDSPFQRFELLPDGRARGPGVIDMKGGDVIIVQALAALRAAGALDRLNVTVVMTGDEEDSGSPLSAARQELLAAAQSVARSEERRVGKECRSRWSPYH